MKRRTLLKSLGLSLALTPLATQAFYHSFWGLGGHHHHFHGKPGSVYTASNAADGNEILVFHRSARGELSWRNSVSTGGLGTGGGLGNQGGIALSDDGRWLLAVNAGSDDLSLFYVSHYGPWLVDTVDSGGQQPISVTLHKNIVYVLNAGGAVGGEDNISGFWLAPGGRLIPIPDATHGLSDVNTGPAQIGFSPDGRHLVVTEKATSAIDVFQVSRDGQVWNRESFVSIGQTPFGFAFNQKGYLLVSEAFGGAVDTSAVTSYEIMRNGDLEAISPSVGTTETAACWVGITRNGKFAFTTNTGSGSVSGYEIANNGVIELLDEDGVTGMVGAGPIDLAMSRNSRFVYVLNAGDDSISVLKVKGDGSLEHIQTVDGLPDGANGMAAE